MHFVHLIDLENFAILRAKFEWKEDMESKSKRENNPPENGKKKKTRPEEKQTKTNTKLSKNPAKSQRLIPSKTRMNMETTSDFSTL